MVAEASLKEINGLIALRERLLREKKKSSKSTLYWIKQQLEDLGVTDGEGDNGEDDSPRAA